MTDRGRRGDGDSEAPGFSLHVLSEYALLADSKRGIMFGPHGDFVWMCAPHRDSNAVFSTLIGGIGVYAPQAFVHALLLESAQRLAAPWPSDTQDNRR